MDVFFKEDDKMESYPCEVRIADGHITLSYEDDGQVIYQGPEVGAGHFRMLASGVRGNGTLHRFSDDDVLEGFWSEAGTYGMWQVQLDE